MSDRERLRTVIARELGQQVDALPDALSVRDAVPDSYALVELVLGLQERTGTRIDGETMNHVVSIGDLLDVFVTASGGTGSVEADRRAS